jgi:PKD repeat protein
MNRWIRPGCLLALLLCSSLLFANRVLVKGTVKFPNGVIVPNFPVLVQTDTTASNTTCRVYKSVVSNPNGVYEAVLECNTNIVKVVISYKNCNGELVKVVKEVPSSAVIEYNILLCTPTNCAAVFGTSFANNTLTTLVVNSSNSHPSGPWPDEIVARRWTWGDGTATDGNLVNATHTYTAAGEYEVCLTIKTRNGCYSTTCKKVIVKPNAGCVAYFIMERTNTPHEWRFHDTSNAATGDEIISRRWTWGDGSTALEGNIKSPTHVFPGAGTYEVCLQIKTKLGCEKKICKTLVIASEPCKANFGFEILTGTSLPPNSFRFNSNTSTAGNPPSDIIARRWDFGDGTIMDGNNINPLHTYKIPGVYTVCLTIKTASNCESKICKQVVVAAGCRALFKWEPVPGAIANPPLSYMAFYGGASHGSNANSTIIGRRWTFGDGTSLVSPDSTVKHGYAQAGTYRVCLYIKTSDGCYDSVCNDVVVPNPPNTSCVPGFNWKQEYLKFQFNSGITAVATGDKVIKRIWHFGDGTSLDGNVVDPVHAYQKPGTYQVCLVIVTERGCEQRICKTIHIGTCEAVFRFEPTPATTINPPAYYFKFFSGASHGSTPNYQVVGRRWTFGDGSVLESNDSNVVHKYEKPGQYQVCLTIKTSDGCYSTTCKTVVIPITTNVPQCQPYFVATITGLKAIFNSETSKVSPGDSIVKRLWIFGDGTREDGNHIKADHSYQSEGQYEVCLVIVTKMGCEQKICKMIFVGSQQNKCYPVFKFENVGSKKIVFNSSGSFSNIANDSIVKRVWSFGDGTSLGGNIISPSHEYRYTGTYTVCLRIITRGGCETTWCQQVKVEGQQYGDSSHVKLVSSYPNPAKANLYAIVWTKHNNVPATLSVYDIYGALKWTRTILLPQGNSTWPVYIGNLAAGPYFLRLQTQYGLQRLQFFKVN